jgi:hypothetical protein
MKIINKSASTFPAANLKSFQVSTHALDPEMPTFSTAISREECITMHSIRTTYAKNRAAQSSSSSQIGGCETVEPINQSRINNLIVKTPRNHNVCDPMELSASF